MMKLTPLALAFALAFPVSASAATNAQLKSEIDMLKAQVAELKKMIMEKATPAPVVVAAPAPPAPVMKPTVDVAEFNRIRVKVEAMEDTKVASGLEGLKISGFIDPTYIFNQRTGRGSVLFLNAQDGSANNLSTDAFGYDNSNFGGATIRFDKTFDNGMLAMMSIRPHKSGTGTIIEEALVTIPLGDGMNAIAGKQITWNGYELAQSPDLKTITHNLLYDFGGPATVGGAGLTFNFAGMAMKTMIGNMNVDRDLPGAANPDHGGKNHGLHWRGDLAFGEFDGYGISGMHGKLYGQNYNYLEADYWYTRGDLTVDLQAEWSRHSNMAFNGGDASHIGLSGLVAYKFAPGWEAIARVDWLDEHKNGGSTYRSGLSDGCPADAAGVDTNGDGVPDAYAASGLCGDYRNGFGAGAVFGDPAGLGLGNVWSVGTNGAKRTAITFGLDYQFHDNALLKLEFRHDRSNLNSFLDSTDGSFRRSNNIFGVQTVVKF